MSGGYVVSVKQKSAGDLEQSRFYGNDEAEIKSRKEKSKRLDRMTEESNWGVSCCY